MTTIYQWYGWPQKVIVNCLQCQSAALVTNHEQIVNRVGPSTRPKKKVYTDFLQGDASCLKCGYLKREKFQWPVDAFYCGEVKGKVLWAWNFEHVKAIKDFISSIDRNYKKYQYPSSLYHLPEHFKLSKNKEACLKALNKMIKK